MRRNQFFVFFIVVFCGFGCGVFKPSPKLTLTDGYYNRKSETGKQKVYIDLQEDSISLSELKAGSVVPSATLNLPTIIPLLETPASIRLSKPSLDIDFLTIPLKYRPANGDVPAQLNANLNGAGYIGYRKDNYTIRYVKSPMRVAERHLDHLGYSFGFFSGIGNTFMSPTNTRNILQQEYDGVVWNKGLAAMFAINNFTMGLAVGVDHLLDNNKSIWIYQGKIWFGLSFGLNLN